jgi:hypothetical protein
MSTWSKTGHAGSVACPSDRAEEYGPCFPPGSARVSGGKNYQVENKDRILLPDPMGTRQSLHVLFRIEIRIHDGLELKYRRLDGRMSSREKQKSIDEFNAPDSPFFAIFNNVEIL